MKAEDQDTKVRPAEGVRLCPGRTITPAELASAIINHARGTNARFDSVLGLVAQEVLVPVPWSSGEIVLVFNSPNGL